MYAYVTGIPICEQCRQKDEDDFQSVKAYINDHRGCSMKEVAEACDVSIEKITRFLKEGRLEIKEGSNILLECENCGQAIKRGRFCQECSRKLEKELSSVSTGSNHFSEEKKNDRYEKPRAGMRYLKS